MLRVIEFEDGARLIVETVNGDVDLPEAVAGWPVVDEAMDALPGELETVSTSTSMGKAAVLLQRQIAALGAVAKAAVNSVAASDVEIQAHFRFTGGVEPIPFLASVRGEGGLKLTLKWKAQAPSAGASGVETLGA